MNLERIAEWHERQAGALVEAGEAHLDSMIVRLHRTFATELRQPQPAPSAAPDAAALRAALLDFAVAYAPGLRDGAARIVAVEMFLAEREATERDHANA